MNQDIANLMLDFLDAIFTFEVPGSMNYLSQNFVEQLVDFGRSQSTN